MEKLDLTTPNFTDENIQKLSELFPNCVTESADGKTIDFDALKQELSSNIVEGNQERYQLTWPGKAESLVTANTPINKTLRPNREESKDFDKTENLYIEGDNLEVLKLLQETYLGKIKMIYIDPPYNTGKDFVYKDNFTQDKAEYDEESGNVDDEGGRLVTNPDSNGRYHSDWLSMMYPRLKLARNLLKDDGVIFISIDDNEAHNLRKVCDEVFGEGNFVGNTVRVSSPSQNTSKFISIMHDYTLVYCKNITLNQGGWSVKKLNVDEFTKRAESLIKKGLSIADIQKELRVLTKYPRFYDFDHYNLCDQTGVFRAGPMGGVKTGNTTTEVLHPKTGASCAKPRGGWRYNEEKLEILISSGQIFFGEDETVVPQRKLYLRDYIEQVPKGVNFFDTQKDVKFLQKSKLPFDFPKPKDYIKYFLEMVGSKSDIILDFFSGSATTAHAVMQLNSEDNGNRKFIMAQIPEATNEKSEAYKAGYNTIPEIGKERIRRAGEKIKEDNTDKEGIDDLDIGFRVLKVDSSNMKQVYFSPDNTSQDDMFDLASNIKDDRSDEDLLFMVLLDWGIDLSVKIERREVADKAVYFADGDFLAACFTENLNEDFVKTLVAEKPRKVVLRDSGFASSSVKINVEQIFKQANIEVKVI